MLHAHYQRLVTIAKRDVSPTEFHSVEEADEGTARMRGTRGRWWPPARPRARPRRLARRTGEHPRTWAPAHLSTYLHVVLVDRSHQCGDRSTIAASYTMPATVLLISIGDDDLSASRALRRLTQSADYAALSDILV